MKEVIVEILEEEKKARERVAEAQKKAKAIRESAGEESKRLLSDAKIQLQKESKAILAKAETEAQKQKEKELKDSEGIGAKLWDGKKREIQTAVDALFHMVLGEERK